MSNLHAFMKSSGRRLQERGLRMEDKLNILPASGKRRTIDLKRTLYHFTVTGDKVIVEDFTHIILPSLGGPESRFQLHWIPFVPRHESSIEGHFVCESLDNIPFKHNGIYTFKTIIERSDVIHLGPNIVEAMPYKELCSGTDELDDAVLNNNALLKSDIPILLTGETGTGKSSLARKIHEASGRTGRFVHLNLSSFSEGLLESELFGHVKGAFTGAINEKAGAMLEAHNGTLFLDEIDSIPLSLQTKLLLFFDSMEIRPVGGNVVRKASSRLVFASGKNLLQQVEQGLMRKDFYFRIGSSVHIQLKSLREKPAHLEAFILNFIQRNGSTIEPSLLKFYKNYSWPGNFRQLRGHLEKKCLGHEGKYLVLDQEDLGLRLNQFTSSSVEGWPSLREMKQAYVLRTYNYFNKNVEMTSSALGVTTRTLKTMLLAE